MTVSYTHLDVYKRQLFHYEKEALEGVEFTVYAAEDIMHPDGVIGLAFHKAVSYTHLDVYKRQD